jgi:lambda repressor-like predicted transcriptional regulator
MINNTKLEKLKKENKPEFIKVSLKLSGFFTLVAFAEYLGVTPEIISMVIHDKCTSRRVRSAIAEACGVPYENLWCAKPSKPSRR